MSQEPASVGPAPAVLQEASRQICQNGNAKAREVAEYATKACRKNALIINTSEKTKQRRRLNLPKRRFCGPKPHFDKPKSGPRINRLTFQR